MTTTEQENQPSVDDEISALYAAAAAVERGEVPAEAASETPSGSEGTEEEQAAQAGSSDETDSETETAEDQDQSGQDQTEDQESDQAPEDSGKELSDRQEDEPPKSKRQQKKDAALTKSWDNANRRHQEADQREQRLAQQEAQLQQAMAKLKQDIAKTVPNDPYPKYSVEEIGQTLSETIKDGDIDAAQGIVNALVQKAKAVAAPQATGFENPEFASQWEANRAKVIADNPDLGKQDSPLFKTATGYLSGPWKDILTAHPAGINAAVEVAKLAIQAESVSELETRVNELEAENKKLRRATQVEATTPTQRGSNSQQKKLSVEEEISQLYAAAERAG